MNQTQNKYLKCCVYPNINSKKPNEWKMSHIKKNGKQISFAQTGDIITLKIKPIKPEEYTIDPINYVQEILFVLKIQN